MEAYVRCCAAICWFLGYGTDRVIAHKEYAPSRKVDPVFQMEGFRRRVQWLLDHPPAAVRGVAPAPAPPTPEGPPTNKETRNMLDQTIPSRINPAVLLRVADLLAIVDEQGWKAERGQQAIIANQAVLNANLGSLLAALDLPAMELPVNDYDVFIAQKIADDRARTEGNK